MMEEITSEFMARGGEVAQIPNVFSAVCDVSRELCFKVIYVCGGMIRYSFHFHLFCFLL